MVSILMAVFNGSEFFSESFKSVLNQTYVNWELIIGINGHHRKSDTETQIKHEINKYPNCKNKVKLLWCPFRNKSKTLNVMVRYASFSKVAILDVDDIWFDNKLKLQMKLVEQFDVVGTSCYYMYGDVKSSFQPKIPVGLIKDFSVNPIINSSVIFNKELAMWDENSVIEDYHLWIKLKNQGNTFYNLIEPLIYHRIHDKSFFNNGLNTKQ